ncbi:hypothetical protein CR513_58981, partial [Mucuna pruriens]
MDVNPMNNNIAHILYSNARSTSNVHTSSSTVNSLERVHHKLLLKLYHHVALKYDPQWLLLDDTISQCTRLGLHRVVTRVTHNIYFTIPPSNSMLAKPNGTICQTLPLQQADPTSVTFKFKLSLSALSDVAMAVEVGYLPLAQTIGLVVGREWISLACPGHLQYSPGLLFVNDFPSEVDPFMEPFPVTMAYPLLKPPLSSMTDR